MLCLLKMSAVVMIKPNDMNYTTRRPHFGGAVLLYTRITHRKLSTQSERIDGKKNISLMYSLPCVHMDQVPDPPITRDQQLLERLRDKDQQAWNAVYKENRNKVVGFLRKNYGVGESEAAEIYQDALVVLAEKLNSLELTSQLHVYLTGIAKNLQQAYFRSKGIKARRELSIDQPTNSASDDDVGPLEIGEEDGLLLEMEAGEQDEIFQRALAILGPTPCGELFQLVYYEKLGQDEIAEKLGRAYGTVRNQLKDCRKKLKIILRDLGWQQ
jgi:RNA polymerase sigma factor (sigma-70 family)